MIPQELTNCFNANTTDLGCPALRPPPGELPLSPNAYSDTLLITQVVAIICSVLVGMAMVLRLFTRAYAFKAFAVEDAMIIFSAIGFVVITALILSSATVGFGKNQWDVTNAEFVEFMRRTYVVQILYCLTIYAAKIGVLLQIKRMFTAILKNCVYRASWAIMIIITLAYTATLFLWIFPCLPVERVWNRYIEGTCTVQKSKPGILSGVINLTSDIVILALPAIGIRPLQQPRKKKLGIYAVFFIGVLACAASILRLYYSVTKISDNDNTFWLTVLATCAIAEIAAVILCGCIPTFPKLYKHLREQDRKRQAYERSASDYSMGSAYRRRLGSDFGGSWSSRASTIVDEHKEEDGQDKECNAV